MAMGFRWHLKGKEYYTTQLELIITAYRDLLGLQGEVTCISFTN
jgi:hypothetical protein